MASVSDPARPITSVHRGLLWAGVVLLAFIATIFVLAPGAVLERMDAQASDRALDVIRVASSAVMAEVLVVVLALRRGSIESMLLVSYLLVAHFAAETVIRMVVLAEGRGSAAAAIPQAVIAIGLVAELVRRRRTSPAPVSR